LAVDELELALLDLLHGATPILPPICPMQVDFAQNGATQISSKMSAGRQYSPGK
jgi:hypothetical protein